MKTDKIRLAEKSNRHFVKAWMRTRALGGTMSDVARKVGTTVQTAEQTRNRLSYYGVRLPDLGGKSTARAVYGEHREQLRNIVRTMQ